MCLQSKLTATKLSNPINSECIANFNLSFKSNIVHCKLICIKII